jgi:hypothetical protein
MLRKKRGHYITKAKLFGFKQKVEMSSRYNNEV